MMKPVTKLLLVLTCAVTVLFFNAKVQANGLQITNVSRGALGGASAANVTFTISWQNSWNVSGLPNNHDAAWVFIKYRECGNGDNWHHALLSTTMGDHSLSAGLAFARPITTVDRLGAAGANNTGALLRRASLGVGHIVNQTVTLRVVGGNGVGGAVTFDNSTEYDIRVIGIEMVQVRQGDYYLGDPNTTNSMNGFSSTNAPGGPMITVNAENATLNIFDPFDATSVCCWSTVYNSKTLPASYPKGWAEFYVMKYEISQGQYADFLNTLSTNAATQRRLGNNGTNRMTLGNTPDGATGRYSATEPNRACNWMGWQDLTAYLDWAALRPMTELEYEKATKGNTGAPYADGSYAWGTTLLSNLWEVRLNENGADTSITAAANASVAPNVLIGSRPCCYPAPYGCLCDNSIHGRTPANVLSNLGAGPVGCGIFARDNTLTRAQTGATYWGIMEMTGNVFEQVVSVYGNAGDNVAGNTISAYTGLWGNGVVANATGLPDVANWPITLRNGRCGYGVRGGSWNSDVNRGRVGDRQDIGSGSNNSTTFTPRNNMLGGRGVR